MTPGSRESQTRAGEWRSIQGLWQTENSCGGFPLKFPRFLALATLLALGASSARSAGREIYPAPSQAKADLAAALRTAASTHKRILLDFGGNWCPDCQVLDIYLHNPANRRILEQNFVLVHINIGHMDANLDIAQRYEIPLEKGVPAVAVLSERGKLLYSQKGGQFEAMSHMEASAVTSFLVQWEPGQPCSVVMMNC